MACLAPGDDGGITDPYAMNAPFERFLQNAATGFTKIHVAGDALGLPVRPIATLGQRNDITVAHDLVDGIDAGALLADKGYDANHFVERWRTRKLLSSFRQSAIEKSSVTTTPISTRSTISSRDFNKLKQFRRVATRYNKLLANFMDGVKLAAIAIWLK